MILSSMVRKSQFVLVPKVTICGDAIHTTDEIIYLGAKLSKKGLIQNGCTRGVAVLEKLQHAKSRFWKQ